MASCPSKGGKYSTSLKRNDKLLIFLFPRSPGSFLPLSRTKLQHLPKVKIYFYFSLESSQLSTPLREKMQHIPENKSNLSICLFPSSPGGFLPLSERKLQHLPENKKGLKFVFFLGIQATFYPSKGGKYRTSLKTKETFKFVFFLKVQVASCRS